MVFLNGTAGQATFTAAAAENDNAPEEDHKQLNGVL